MCLIVNLKSDQLSWILFLSWQNKYKNENNTIDIQKEPGSIID